MMVDTLTDVNRRNMARGQTVMEATDTDGCCPSLVAAPLDESEASELARGFTALADPVRLRLLSMLAVAPAGEICVCEFIAPIGKTQGTISHHLKILGEAGLVHGDRRGKWVWYSLDRDRLADLQSALGT
jgi:ArsR family transcriptional regulator